MEPVSSDLENQPFYLKLSNPLKFEAVSRARLNNVFFDECNNQVRLCRPIVHYFYLLNCLGKPYF